MDPHKFKTLVDRVLYMDKDRRYVDPDQGIQLRPRPITEQCGDCDRRVENRVVHFYIKYIGSPRASWYKKCLKCDKIIKKSPVKINMYVGDFDPQ